MSTHFSNFATGIEKYKCTTDVLNLKPQNHLQWFAFSKSGNIEFDCQTLHLNDNFHPRKNLQNLAG